MFGSNIIVNEMPTEKVQDKAYWKEHRLWHTYMEWAPNEL